MSIFTISIQCTTYVCYASKWKLSCMFVTAIKQHSLLLK